MSAVPATGVLHEIVELACRAPSMYNAQPWAWRVAAGGLELYADRSRRIPVADPLDRNLVIGCGAALHHARVAAAAAGWTATVRRLPDPDRPDLLAVLELRPADEEADEARLVQALRTRRTDRRQFSSWPVPPERLDALAEAARLQGAHAVPVVDEARRHALDTLVADAVTRQSSDEKLAEERRAWLDRSATDGVPLTTVPRLVGRAGSSRSRFGAGLLAQPWRELEPADGALVLCGPEDAVGSWLRGGEGLSALWLRAVDHGLSVQPLTQVVEVEETRRALKDDVAEGWSPFLLLRVGWHSATEEPLRPTPRRPLHDVLLG